MSEHGSRSVSDPIVLLQDAIKGERHLLSGYRMPSEALTLETLRALDFTFCRELIPEFKEVDASERRLASIRKHSVNAALSHVLPTDLKKPASNLFKSNAGTAEQTDEFLFRMGCLTMAERQLTLLRSGALKGEIEEHDQTRLLVLSVQDNTAYREQIGFQGLGWLSDSVMAEDRPKESDLEHRHLELLPRLTSYLRGRPSPGDRILIDLDGHFREWAVLYLRRMSFRDMLADDDRFGGRAYSDYVAVLEALSAMSQQRLCYAGLLNADDATIGIRNILTGAATHEELTEGIADFLDGTHEEVAELLDHLMLSPANAGAHLDRGTPALAPAVRTSQGMVVLPMYGLELNPFIFLWTELRKRYPRDWFDAANLRELRWVSELRAQFLAPRWHCFDGVKLKRAGKTVTDIDFVAYDSHDQSVILFQLKWQQPPVQDDRLRRNNASSLVGDSNKWISDVADWIEMAGNSGIKERLSIRTGEDLTIHLVILGRYHAHFTASLDHDPRALWCDWGNFLRHRLLRPQEAGSDFIQSLAKSVREMTASVQPESFFIPLGDLVVLTNPRRIQPARG